MGGRGTRFPEFGDDSVFECLVEPVAVVLGTDPTRGPEGEDEGDLSEDYGVGGGLGPVPCF